MARFTIVIGNKNYSSWSLRGWIALRSCTEDFDEIPILLRKPTTGADIRAHSPAGKVPVLIDGGRAIWDSLAICEYLAGEFPDAGLWPEDLEARAHARAVSAEMHAGFVNLRNHMPMNCRASLPGRGATQAALTDIARIEAMWNDCRARFGGGGDFLFGHFTAADAMYAPVASRLATYQPALGPTASAYVEAIHGLPAMAQWIDAARAEPDRLVEMER
ncbi:MAG: glutathione S-transferase family protein [Proteobacteria bacterium]|nr:glutathione S-transferase family protein [Pseudomonadota bacterium]